MNDQKMTGREVLEEAMRQYDMTYCDSFPPCEEEINLGRVYDEKMSKLIKKSKNPFWYYIRKIGKMAAMLVLVLGVVMGMSLISHGERKISSDLYAKPHIVRPDYLIYYCTSSEDAPKKIETKFELTYIPEGYILTDRHSYYKKVITIWYEDGQGNIITFEQKLLSSGVGVDLTKDTVETIRIRDVNVLCIRGGGITVFFWGNYGYTFRLNFYGECSQEEIVRMIESMQKVRD